MDGIGWFTGETMPRLAKNHPEHQFYFLFDRPWDPLLTFPTNVKPLYIGPVTRLPFLIKCWNTISVPLLIKKIKPDLYFSPDGFLPPSLPCPSLVALHDLNFEHFPEFLPYGYRLLYRKWARRAAIGATRIITVSEFSKKDIASCYPIIEEKIDVVYSGLNSFIRPVTKNEIEKTLDKLGITCDYFLVTGSLHPRKNIHRVIEAFHLFRNRFPGRLMLVFAGNNKWWSRAMQDALDACPYRKDILFTGRLNDADMNAVIKGAKAMVFVSLFEGFGLPIIEAAKAEIPVITSDHSSMREIAGDSALLVNPMDVQEIATAMNTIITDENLRQELIQKSRPLTTRYSWERTADLVWESILKALKI